MFNVFKNIENVTVIIFRCLNIFITIAFVFIKIKRRVNKTSLSSLFVFAMLMLFSCVTSEIRGLISLKGTKLSRFAEAVRIAWRIPADFQPLMMISFPSFVVIWVYNSANYSIWRGFNLVSWSLTSISSTDFTSSICLVISDMYQWLNLLLQCFFV